MKRRPKTGAARAAKPKGPRSAKALQIVALVEALSGDVGSRDGVHLGTGIARLLARVYPRRGAAPSWVKDVIAYYSNASRES